MICCDDVNGCGLYSFVFWVMRSFFVQDRRVKCDENENGVSQFFLVADFFSTSHTYTVLGLY